MVPEMKQWPFAFHRSKRCVFIPNVEKKKAWNYILTSSKTVQLAKKCCISAVTLMGLNWCGFASAYDVKWLTGSDNKKKLVSVKYMIYVHHLSSNYQIYQSEWQYSSCQRHRWRVSTIQSRLLMKLLSTRGYQQAQEPRLNKTARLPFSRRASPKSFFTVSMEKRLDMFDTGQIQNHCCHRQWGSHRRSLVAVPEKNPIFPSQSSEGTRNQQQERNAWSERDNEITALKRFFRLPRWLHWKILDMKICNCGSVLNLNSKLSTEK